MTCPSCGHDGLPPLVCERCGHRWYATPAPLDVERLAEAIDKHRMPLLICDDCGDESRNPECRSCGGRMHLATPAPLDARGTPYSMESVRSWMGLDVWLSLGHDFHDWPGWTADGWADMMAEIRPLAATPAPLRYQPSRDGDMDPDPHGEWVRYDTDDGWQERGNPGDPATPAPLDGHQTPGEYHDYRVACVKCGEPGFLHVSWRPETWADPGSLTAALNEEARK